MSKIYNTNAETMASCQVKELALLFNISSRLNETIDLRKISKLILPIIAEYTEMKRGTIILLKKSSHDIIIEERHGFSDGIGMQMGYQADRGIVSKVIYTMHPAVMLTVSERLLSLDKNISRRLVVKDEAACICVPIKTRGKITGALAVDRIFDNSVPIEEDIRILKSIALVIAQAVQLREAAEEEHERLLEEIKNLKSELYARNRTDAIIGDSKAIQNICHYIYKVSDSNSNVLIIGEGGVGKERIARAIHSQSSRSNQAFIKVVCSNLPEPIIESELFGHEESTIIGAGGRRRGGLDIARGGTLFLDEIAALTPLLQAKLLHVLKEGKFERCGGNRQCGTNVRIIAATSSDLESQVRKGKFREDLYYHLNVFPIIVPPLRERRQDIVLLANYFIEQYAKEAGKEVNSISHSAMDSLINYKWPGNVQELKGYIERAVVLSTDGVIHHNHLPPSMQRLKIRDHEED